MQQPLVWLVEDEQGIADTLIYMLQQEGFSVEAFERGFPVLEKSRQQCPDAIILDVGLPDISGFELCRRLLERHPALPILFLTARSDDVDRLLGLDLGADEYMTKPFGIMELISRVKALLRRSGAGEEKEKILKQGKVVLDRERHMVFVGDTPCELTYKEYELLKLLMLNAGIVTTRGVILDRIWGTDFEGESRTLDMHIKTLRQKLGEAGSMIKTVRNVGYILNE